MDDTAYFVITPGADWAVQIVLENDDGSAMNLDGCQVHLQLRPTPESNIVLADMSTTTGSIQLDGAVAQVNWVVAAATTSGYSPSPGVVCPPLFGIDCAWFGEGDLMVEWPDGSINPYLRLKVALNPSGTRPV